MLHIVTFYLNIYLPFMIFVICYFSVCRLQTLTKFIIYRLVYLFLSIKIGYVVLFRTFIKLIVYFTLRNETCFPYRGSRSQAVPLKRVAFAIISISIDMSVLYVHLLCKMSYLSLFTK